mmetsp:Transcript_14518/g.23823  ORF Transcript_14518/g.23823 Transcript_14518/m.23823 type:complete len:305 (+) Transcript_14518:2-916(+)
MPGHLQRHSDASTNLDMERIANMPLRTPSPHSNDYAISMPPGNYEAQNTVMSRSSGDISADTSATRAALASANTATPDETEGTTADPLPPCLSPDLLTQFFCASRVAGKASAAKESSYLLAYNKEREYFDSSGDVAACQTKLDEFWSNVDESQNSPRAKLGSDSREMHLNAEKPLEHPQHSEDTSVREALQHPVSGAEEISPEKRLALADKELQIATWTGDAARLESAIAEGRAAGVSASALSIAEKVLRQEINKKRAEDELNDAASGRDAFRLKSAISDALKYGVMPSKLRVAKGVLRDLQED